MHKSAASLRDGFEKSYADLKYKQTRAVALAQGKKLPLAPDRSLASIPVPSSSFRTVPVSSSPSFSTSTSSQKSTVVKIKLSKRLTPSTPAQQTAQMASSASVSLEFRKKVVLEPIKAVLSKLSLQQYYAQLKEDAGESRKYSLSWLEANVEKEIYSSISGFCQINFLS